MPVTPSIEPGFHAIHANHLEDLRRAVVWICRQSPLPPLESETFLVQSNGIAQWLKLALAEDPSEEEFLRKGTGPMAAFLVGAGVLPSGWTPPADIEKGQNILIEGKRISKALPISAYFTNEFVPGS